MAKKKRTSSRSRKKYKKPTLTRHGALERVVYAGVGTQEL